MFFRRRSERKQTIVSSAHASRLPQAETRKLLSVHRTSNTSSPQNVQQQMWLIDWHWSHRNQPLWYILLLLLLLLTVSELVSDLLAKK